MNQGPGSDEILQKENTDLKARVHALIAEKQSLTGGVKDLTNQLLYAQGAEYE